MQANQGQHGTPDAPTLADITEACDHLRLALRRYSTEDQRRGMATMLRNAAEHAEFVGHGGTELVLMALYATVTSTVSQPG